MSLRTVFSSWLPPEKKIDSERKIIPKPLEHFLDRYYYYYMLPRKKRFDVKDLSNHLGKTIPITVQMEPKKTIKHVELGLCTKRKTGSRRFITLLNRLGHCISYNEVNLVETSIAEEQINNFSTAAFVPSTIRSSEFVAFVYDNIDINIEYIYNKSCHC